MNVAIVLLAVVNLMQAPVNLRGSSFKGEPRHVDTITENYYTAVNDGKAETCWEPMEARGPHFIEMLFNQFVSASSVEWEVEGVEAATLSRFVKGEWVKVAEMPRSGGRSTFGEIASDRWRVDITGFKGVPKIRELRLFGPDQYLLPGEIPQPTDKGRVELVDPVMPKGVYQPGDEVEIEFSVKTGKDTLPFGLLVELSDREARDVLMGEGMDFCSRRWAVKPDAAGRVKLALELPPWTPHGTNDILVTALADATGRRIMMPDRYLGSFVVERADLPQMPPPVESVKVGDNEFGQRGFVINGRWHPAFFNRYYGNPTPERLAATGKTGLEILFWQNRDGMPVDEKALEDRILWFDRRIRMALRINPNNYFILSQVIKAGSNWLRAHPSEKMLLEDGTPNPENLVSFGSDEYWKDTENYLRRLIGFMKRQPYGDRIISYHLWTCTLNDCYIGGGRRNGRMKSRDDFLLGDYHPGAIRRFREFLARKYGNDVAALRRAWRDDVVAFDTAFVGRRAILRDDFGGTGFRDPVASRPAIDYCEFLPHLIGDYNRMVAAVVKRETGGRALTMFHAGAVAAHLTKAWGEQLQSSNNDFADLERDPNVDIFVQAQPYNTREAGNAMHVYAPAASIGLNGKLYIFDHDHRSLSSGVLKYGRHRSQHESAAVFPRDFAHQWIENAGAWISDMSLSRWFNFDQSRLPWFTTPEVLNPIHDSLAAMRALDLPRKRVAEIAIVLSLNSPRYEDACRMIPHYKGLVNDFLLKDVMPFLGAPYDVILTSDLAKPNLPNYKLMMFLNPTYFTVEERKAIENLKSSGRTLAWFYAPGYSTDDGLSLAAAKAVCGFDLKIKDGAPETPEMIYNNDTALSKGLGTKIFTAANWFGVSNFSPLAIRPIFYADDPRATVAAVYGDGRAAYGYKDFGGWKSVWCGVPNFDMDAMTRLAKFAGVHLYAEAPVVLNCDSRMMMVHNGYEGERTVKITLPRPALVGDLYTNEKVAEGTAFDLRLASPETRLLKLSPVR